MTTTTTFTTVSSEDQARRAITVGQYELYLPGHEHRILFADSVDQLIQWLDCYLQVDADLDRTVHALVNKPSQLTDGITRWSSRLCDVNGNVAYLAKGASSRRLPRHTVGENVRFYMENESYRVTGLSLQFVPEENSTRWLYHYGEGQRLGWGVSERITRYGATARDLAREMQQYRDQEGDVYYRVVLAEDVHVDVTAYNTFVAGPWHGLDRDALWEVVAVILPYAFTIRLYRV